MTLAPKQLGSVREMMNNKNFYRKATNNDQLWAALAVSTISFVLGLVVFDLLATIKFKYIFFDHVPSKPPHSTFYIALKFAFATALSILSGLAYHFQTSKWDLVFAARLPLAILLGFVGVAILAVGITILLAILGILLLLWALFFGPGDR